MDIYATNPGPFDDSVLYDQDKHVSSAVWEGQERGALRCHEHTSKLDQWTLTPRQIDLVKMAGFGPLRLIPAISLDNPLISALVERWRRETNTFHFTVGEMTVTLEDVAYLLGLPIDGDPVIGVTYTSCEAVCVKYLGRAPGSGYTSGGMVKLSWLKETFSRCPVDAPIQEIERHTRAYLLYLVGSTIFSTTTGNKVPVMYLPLFDNFEQAGRYAWGAAALAFLYRALGNASLKSQSTISGCLTMLQCWSFYHLNVGRPRLNHDPVHDCFPFVLRWKGKQSSPTANRDVPFYRKALDALKETDVEWCPYTHNHHALLPEEIKNTLIVGRSKTMLICFDKAERHLPDRCLRQYGMKQKIPAAVPLWERKSRGVDGGVDLSGKMETELAEWSDRHRCIEDSYDEYADENEYMMWYTRISRKVIGRPVPISSEYQRMNAALRDIAHLADALYNSTHGMDDAQIYSVTRIHSIVHDCLRDQGGSPLVMVSNPENEMVKTVRGKEKVRRKGMGKRRRKDELEERNATAEAQLCGVADEIDAVDLHHQQLSHMDIEVVGMEHQHLCLPVGDGDVDDEQLCDPADIICDSELANVEESEVKSSSFGDEDDKPHTDDVQLSALETNEEVAQQNDCSVLV